MSGTPRVTWAVLRSTGAILRREFLGLLRSRKGFWIAVLTVAATALIPLSNWPGERDPLPAVRGREAFESYCLVTQWSLLIFVPLVAWTSFSGERKRGTLVMLLSTPLRPEGIILGKLLSTAGFFLLLVALTFPMAASLYVLGGFKAWEFLDILETECLLILGLSMVGPWLLSSYWRERPRALILDFPQLPQPPPSHRPWQRGSRGWPVSMILAKAKEGIPDGWNPVMVASLRSGWLDSFTRWGCLTLVLVFFAVFATLLFSLASALIACGLACSMVISERERGTLELLRATPLDPLAILGGKLRAVLVTSLPLLIAVAVACAASIAFQGGTGVMRAFFLLAAFAVTILIAATAGLLGAVLSRTRQTAMVLSYLICLSYLLALPLLSRDSGLSPLTVFQSQDMVTFPIALGVGLEIAGIQFAVAMGIFEMTWMRDR